MFGWFDSKAHTQFGEELADYFIGKMPPGQPLVESKRASKTQYLLDKMQGRVRDFRAQRSSNAFQKAKLANRFRWKLSDAGYEQEYVDTLVAWLVNKL